MTTAFTDLQRAGRGINNSACNAFALTELQYHDIPVYDLEVSPGMQYVATIAGFMSFEDGQKALFLRRSKEWMIRLSTPLTDCDLACIGAAVNDPDRPPCPRKGQDYYVADHGVMVLMLEYLRRDHGALRPATAGQVRDHVFLRPGFLSEACWVEAA